MEFPETASDCRIVTRIARLKSETTDDCWVLMKLKRDLASGLTEENSCGGLYLFPFSVREWASTGHRDGDDT